MISEKIFDKLGNKELIGWVSGLITILDRRGVKIYNYENKKEYIENIIKVDDSFYYVTAERGNLYE